MLSDGFIKWHRKVFDSVIWQNHNDFILAFRILGTANWKEGIWRTPAGGSVKVPRGSLITSSTKLAHSCGMTRQEVRTSLAHLVKCDFLTIESTNHYLLINITNYSKYQDHDNQQVNPRLTSGQPAPNQHLTTIEEGKEGEERKETALARTARKDTPFQEFTNWYIHEVLKIDRANKDAIDAAYRRFGKAARDVMAFAGKDVQKAISGTKAIAGWAERKNLSWNLDTIAKRMPDWMACPSEFEEEKSKW